MEEIKETNPNKMLETLIPSERQQKLAKTKELRGKLKRDQTNTCRVKPQTPWKVQLQNKMFKNKRNDRSMANKVNVKSKGTRYTRRKNFMEHHNAQK